METKELEKPNEAALHHAKNHDIMVCEYAQRDFMLNADQNVPDVPTLSTPEVQALRVRLIREELEELEAAYAAGDIVEVADAVTDLFYVILGTSVAHGLNMKALYRAVHDNNMYKLKYGYKDEGGKWIKPADHRPPDLRAVLDAQWRANPFRASGDAVSCTVCMEPNRAHRNDDPPYDATLVVMCDGRRVKL